MEFIMVYIFKYLLLLGSIHVLSANPKLEAAHEYFENKANDITGMIILGAILLIGVGALVYMKFKK